MLLLLGAFAIVPMLLPWLVARMGARAFLVAALLPAAAFVQAAVQTPAIIAGDIPSEAFDWIPSLGIRLSMRMDTLSWLMALIVTGVGALIMVYCRWYFRGRTEGLGQFAAVLLAFAGAMYGLVLTDDLVVLVMCWELTSVLSYLLIGYYNRRAVSRRAALQALLVTTLGGLVMLIGVVRLDDDQPVAGVVTDQGLDAVGPVGWSLHELDPLGGQLLEGLAAVVGGQSQSAHGALGLGPADGLDHVVVERGTGDREGDLEVEVVGMAHGAPPVAVAHGDVGALDEAQLVDVEGLGLVLVGDVERDE